MDIDLRNGEVSMRLKLSRLYIVFAVLVEQYQEWEFDDSVWEDEVVAFVQGVLDTWVLFETDNGALVFFFVGLDEVFYGE